ncbi:type IV fimbrial biogenesis protein FimT [Collimonas sp. OK307]|uniref:GspH/FimT family pseudopilin n=1 Tax=Collimonas sp. OK307 TaxID=1801620 RepID=UPI0008E6B313|nr:GspH/FimT family pseudopilin [Collimonas sp. OK307]SFI20411.1 type IV fimbrial biogenesis protein FimT [Collimonas sp. OK307]
MGTQEGGRVLIRVTKFQRGVTLIELLIALAVMAIAFSLGMPSYSAWIQNSQIRTAAESMQSGIQLARAEGLRSNATVRFQLTTTTDATCALSSSGTNWVISANDATGKCNVTDSTVDPFMTRVKASAEGTKNVTVAATQSSISFNGLGRVTPAPTSTITIDIKNPSGGTCVAASGNMRCLQLQVSGAGQVRMCDPAVTATSDPRKC